MYSQPAVQPAIERRITLRLLRYWEKLRTTRDMPSEKDVNSTELADLWGNCIIVQIQDNGGNYNISHIGTSLMDPCLSMLPKEAGVISKDSQYLRTRCLQVINTLKPLIDEGQYFLPEGNIVKYRQCLLPLGENGRVTAILGGMHFKVFSS